jgi:alpha-tubulin suppressor-like RCC1 family protein
MRYGKLGIGCSNRPCMEPTVLQAFFPGSQPDKPAKLLQVACGLHHTLILTDCGQLYGVGRNIESQLGNGNSRQSLPTPCPIQVPEKVCFVTASTEFSAAVTASGNVFTWGENKFGRLGHADNEIQYNGTSGRALRTPVQIETFVRLKVQIKRVSCGYSHMLSLTKDGKVYSCGKGEFGRLGHENEEDVAVPTMVQALDAVLVLCVQAGAAHSVVSVADRRVLAWGANSYGQLGLGHTKHSNVPEVVNEYEGGVADPEGDLVGAAIGCGTQHTVVITGAGAVLAWGDNTFGQLGVPDLDANVALSPVQVRRLVERLVPAAARWWTWALPAVALKVLFHWFCCAALPRRFAALHMRCIAAPLPPARPPARPPAGSLLPPRAG